MGEAIACSTSDLGVAVGASTHCPHRRAELTYGCEEDRHACNYKGSADERVGACLSSRMRPSSNLARAPRSALDKAYPVKDAGLLWCPIWDRCPRRRCRREPFTWENGSARSCFGCALQLVQCQENHATRLSRGCIETGACGSRQDRSYDSKHLKLKFEEFDDGCYKRVRRGLRRAKSDWTVGACASAERLLFRQTTSSGGCRRRENTSRRLVFMAAKGRAPYGRRASRPG